LPAPGAFRSFRFACDCLASFRRCRCPCSVSRAIESSRSLTRVSSRVGGGSSFGFDSSFENLTVGFCPLFASARCVWARMVAPVSRRRRRLVSESNLSPCPRTGRVLNHAVPPVLGVSRARVLAPMFAALDSLATLDTFAWVAFDHTYTKRSVWCLRCVNHLGFASILLLHSCACSLLESEFVQSVQSDCELIRLAGITSWSLPPAPRNTKRAARRKWQTARIVL